MSITRGSALLIAALWMLIPYTCMNAQTETQRGDSAFAVCLMPSAGAGILLHQQAAGIGEAWLLPACAIFWKPNRRLNLGVEAAYLELERVSQSIVSEEYGNTEMHAKLDAYALVLLFDMEVWKLNLSGGMGASLVQSSIEAYGSTINVSNWMATYYGSAAYLYPIFDRAAIGVKAGVYSIPKLDKITSAVSLVVSYDMLRW